MCARVLYSTVQYVFMLSGFHSRLATQDMFVCVHGNVLFYPPTLFFVLRMSTLHWNLVCDAQNRQSVFEEGI